MPAFRMRTAHDDQCLLHAALLINHSERSYQCECLEALHLARDVINAKTYTLYSATHLYARKLPPICFSIRDARFLQSLFNVRNSDAVVDLYVARGHTRRRRIRNESDVIALVRALGFTIFDPSGQTVREQARQFASARRIIGFHGAGLTNTLFCRKDTKVIEIFDPGYVANFYSNIALQLGLEYRRIIHGTDSKKRLGGIAEDISVDIGILEAELKCAI